jgi:hypothetical protein
MNRGQRALAVGMCLLGALFFGSIWGLLPAAEVVGRNRTSLQYWSDKIHEAGGPAHKVGYWEATSYAVHYAWEHRDSKEDGVPSLENYVLGVAFPFALLGVAGLVLLGAKKKVSA